MRIAVAGAGIVSAIGIGVGQTLDSIRALRSGIGEVSLFPTVHRVPVGEVRMPNEALASLSGVTGGKPRSRTALLGMLAAREALRDAGVDPSGSLRVGLVSATSVGGMDLTEEFYREFMADDRKGRLRQVVAHERADRTLKIAEYCGIGAFTTTLSTACSSAANAIMLGARLIRGGMLDCVVAGGTDALCRFTLNGFRSLMILDSQPCRPFDRSRAGLNLGEGAGYVVLMKEECCSRKPYGYLSGYANANDAFHQTASSADGEGAWLAMRGALNVAGLEPDSIGYVNVHGTGTPNNDASEARALSRLFGKRIPPFSSTKPFTGHTLAAAGGIEAVLSVIALQRGILYPNLRFAEPMDEGMIPCTEYREGVGLRHVMSNSFGFGGNCTTLIFSEG